MGIGAWIFLVAGILAISYFLRKTNKLSDSNEVFFDNAKNDDIKSSKMDVSAESLQNLVIQNLKKIACQPEINESNDICFQYQGASFIISTQYNNSIITILNIWKSSFSLEDPSIGYLKEAINQVNLSPLPTAVYSIDEEEKILGLHFRLTLLLISEIPDIADYLRINLDNFFIAYQHVMDNCRALKEQHKSNERVVVKGFG